MDTKAKINLREGVVELEGSEEFVKKYLDEFKQLLNKSPIPISSQQSFQPQQNYQKQQQQIKPKQQKSSHKGVNVTPIPIDLKSANPNLKDFFNEKFENNNPNNNQEIITIFIYYLNKILEIEDVLPGHIVSCYNEIGLRKPLNIPQFFRDIPNRKGWIESSKKTSGSVNITISGENFVKHDLPRVKDVKSNQNPVKE